MHVAKPKNDPHTKSQWHEEMTDGKPFMASCDNNNGCLNVKPRKS